MVEEGRVVDVDALLSSVTMILKMMIVGVLVGRGIAVTTAVVSAIVTEMSREGESETMIVPRGGIVMTAIRTVIVIVVNVMIDLIEISLAIAMMIVDAIVTVIRTAIRIVVESVTMIVVPLLEIAMTIVAGVVDAMIVTSEMTVLVMKIVRVRVAIVVKILMIALLQRWIAWRKSQGRGVGGGN
jgi:hypothetical protein